MPELDGLELIRRIRARDGAGYVYVILLTAKAQKEDVVEGMEAGADDFVAKPFDRDELRVRLWEGERMIQLHQTLGERNRALQEAQDALSESKELSRRGQMAAAELGAAVSQTRQSLTSLWGEVLAAVPSSDQRERLNRRFAECMEVLRRAEA